MSQMLICDDDGYPVEMEILILQLAQEANDYTLESFRAKVRFEYGVFAMEYLQRFLDSYFFKFEDVGVKLTAEGQQYKKDMEARFQNIKKRRGYNF